jgi:transposase
MPLDTCNDEPFLRMIFSLYQQSQCWIKAGVFESLVQDMRTVLRAAEGRKESPTKSLIAGLCNRRPRAVHAPDITATAAGKAVPRPSLSVSELAKRVQSEAGKTVEIAPVDQGHTGKTRPMKPKGMESSLKWSHLTAKRGFALLPRRWVIERSFGLMSRFRRLARDCERLPELWLGLYYLAFIVLMLKNVAEILA